MNTIFTREMYIPKAATKVAHKASGRVVYVYEREGHPCAMGYLPKSQKPAFQYRYTTASRREKAVRDFFQAGAEHADAMNKRRADEKASTHKFEVGTVLRTSWGYDQTNVDFYKVSKVVSGKTVEVVKIGGIDASRESGCSPMSGKVVPDLDKVIGEPMRIRANAHGAKIDGHHASVWDGKPCYVSWYA